MYLKSVPQGLKPLSVLELRIKGTLQEIELAAVAPGGGFETGVDRGFGRR
jgi:hypothetical protein